MEENFIRSRITKLRIEKGVSEYKMSTDMGHSKSYIQSITSGRALPSLSEFLYMCEYPGITPSAFFDESNENPVIIEQIMNNVKKLNENDLSLVLSIVDRLNQNTK